MITEQEAVARARALIRQKQIDVREVQSVRKLDATVLPPSYAAKGDLWVVEFALDVPEDEVWSPSEVFVNVNCQTGEATMARGL